MKKIILLSLAVITLYLGLSTTKCFAQTELVSTGSGSAYDIAYPAAFTYSAGITITFKAHATSTAGPITLNINALGARTIKKNVTADLALGDIMLNQYVTVIYDGTNFQLTSPLPGGSSNGWSLGGNAVTSLTTIGTTSNYDFPIITNGVERMRFAAAGGIAIGSTNPAGAALRVSGNDVWFDNNTSGFYQTSATSIGMGYAQQVYDASSGATGSPTMRYVFSPRNNNDSGTSNFGDLTFGKVANQDYGYIAFSSRNAGGTYAERVRIDAEGNMGVGTNSPQARLQVFANSNTATLASISGSVPSLGAQRFSFSAGDVLDIGFQSTPNYAAWIQAGYNGSAESILLNPLGGPVGIGNNAPTEALDVTGNIKFSGALMPNNDAGTAGQVLTSSGGGVPIWTTLSGGGLSGGTNNYVTKWTSPSTLSSSSLLYDNGSGVGIGTSSPAGALDIISTNIFPLIAGSSSSESIFDFKNTSPGGKSWWFVTGGSGGALSGGKFGIFDPSASTTRFTIDINGYVGIGTTSPTEMLDINGNLKLAYAFMPGNNAGASGQILTSQGVGNPPLWTTGGLLSGGSTNYIPKWNSSTSLAISQVYDNGTNVGIGTSTPVEKLTVGGNILFPFSSSIMGANGNPGWGADVNLRAGNASVGHGGGSVEVRAGAAYSGSLDGGNVIIVGGGHQNTPSRAGDILFYTGQPAAEIMHIDGSTANVGIKTATPSEALEVVGNIEIPAANEYKYATAKTLYYTIPSIEFMPMNSAFTKASEVTHFEVYSNSGVAGTAIEFTAPIHLPEDAQINTILVSVYDNDITYAISGDLIVYDANTDAIANYPTGGSGLNPGNTSISVNPGVVVDNLNKMYYLKIYLRQNNANLRIRGARVNYTVTKVD